MAPPSNETILTRAHTAYTKKKRAKRDEIKEIVFDDDVRREFLTGFHKRKLQRTEERKTKRLEREKQGRLEARREQRQILAEQALENAAQVEAAYGGQVLSMDEEWGGTSKSKADKGKGKEEEYEDEEQLATVTVVEDFDPATLMDGPPPTEEEAPIQNPPAAINPKSKRPEKTSTMTKKPRAKKVRYETKAARTAETKKQRNRKMEKAERAGGKASRKPKGKGIRKR